MARTPPRLGFLYPGIRASDQAILPQAESDYPLAAMMVEPRAEMRLVRTKVQEDAHREDALRQTGELRVLFDGATELRPWRPDCIMWACTSGSFVFGLDGATEQARELERHAGVPASSTSLAFVAACRQLGAQRVAIAASYPTDVVGLLARFLASAGIDVVGHSDEGIMTGVEVGTLDIDRVTAMVASADRSTADAILVPDTAMQTIAHLDRLDSSAGKPVLTANQVSVWQALVLAGHPARQKGMGALFAT